MAQHSAPDAGDYLFRNQFRVSSSRLNGYDYTKPGWYFVTIRTFEGRHYFGQIIDDQVELSEAGQIAAEEWKRTEFIRQNVTLDAWVVMPNHVHGLIGILPDPTTTGKGDRRTMVVRPQLQAGSLSAIIGQYKSVCSKRIRGALNSGFGWQARFYDHVVRSEHALQRIRTYIQRNPAEWNQDPYFE